jgi:hypothetical protein
VVIIFDKSVLKHWSIMPACCEQHWVWAFVT